MGVARGVAVTGIGVIGPTGLGRQPFWDAITRGVPAIGPITRFDAQDYPSRIGGEIRDVSYRDLVPPGKLRHTARVTQYALAALELALRDARLDPADYESHTCGVALGTSLGGLHEAQQEFAILLEKGSNRVNPFLLGCSPNYAAAMEVAIAARAQGAHATFATGCCASTHAIGHAAELIARGEIDCCIAGGTEAPIIPLVFAAMSRTRELCCNNDDPAHASRPFDRGHSGFVLSEGSTVLVLEELDRARQRGASIYALVLGAASSIDATEGFRVDQSGIAAARAIHACLDRSGVGVADLDYVCANANSAPQFDKKETAALRLALGESGALIPVSSIKGVLGHPFGASGAFQVAAACMAIRENLIPPTVNLDDPDPDCDLNFVRHAPRSAALRHVLVCSCGFGGMNGCIILRAPDPTSR